MWDKRKLEWKVRCDVFRIKGMCSEVNCIQCVRNIRLKSYLVGCDDYCFDNDDGGAFAKPGEVDLLSDRL